MKKFCVFYIFDPNQMELEAFFVQADDRDHAVEQFNSDTSHEGSAVVVVMVET